MSDFRNPDVILDIHDRPKFLMWLGLSFQHLFAMFGSTVIVPILVGIDPSIALLSSGLGTLAHLTVTKYKIPAYMGSSFAYIGAMSVLKEHGGMGAIGQGAIAGGIVYLVVAVIVKYAGREWLNKVLPPIVVGPIVMVIGLNLAATAVNEASFDGSGNYDIKFVAVAAITLLAVVIFNMFFKGFLGLIPILLGIVTGYVAALLFGIVDLGSIASAPLVSNPLANFGAFFTPHIYWGAILTMAPIAFVTMTEHFGHVMILNTITKRDFFKDPGLNKTLAGDGAAQIIAGILGAPPVTSYGENIGVMTITRIHSIFVIGGAAVFAILLSIIGKVSAVITSIPGPVIGGVSFVLFGVIAAAGLRIIVEEKIDFGRKRNLLIASIVLVVGIGNLIVAIPGLEVTGVAVATVIGIVLNLVLPEKARNED
ncbi:MAG: NCS2 family nucleobase:cation symporter [Lactobacillales bacterium]|jgi:uracil permease|nr:NCS2 family nucleobase:cation symporter [Lactobacillales bacterium]